MRKIIEVKNERCGLAWTEVEPRPQRDENNVVKSLQRLVADEKVNKHGYEYRIRSING